MRIALIGWYGHDNAGDDRILHCLNRFFQGHEVVWTTSLNDAAARISELNTCDYVLLGGGGLILRGTGWFAGVVERLTPRFGCIGISIEARHRDNARLLEAIKQRAEFILVRDARSRELLDCHHKTIVGPDLTFLYPFDVAPAVARGGCALNLRPWRFWRGEHNGRFDRFMRWLEPRVDRLERFYPAASWDPARLVGTLQQKFPEIFPLPLYHEKGECNDRDILGRHFTDVPARFEASDLARCQYLVGMRLHSLIFACQLGLPFLSLSYEPKNVEFCKSLGIPELSLDIFDPGSFAPAMDHLISGYDRIRGALIEARGSNCREITAIMGAISDLMN